MTDTCDSGILCTGCIILIQIYKTHRLSMWFNKWWQLQPVLDSRLPGSYYTTCTSSRVSSRISIRHYIYPGSKEQWYPIPEGFQVLSYTLQRKIHSYCYVIRHSTLISHCDAGYPTSLTFVSTTHTDWPTGPFRTQYPAGTYRGVFLHSVACIPIDL